MRIDNASLPAKELGLIDFPICSSAGNLENVEAD
jgi:hypothetical protein